MTGGLFFVRYCILSPSSAAFPLMLHPSYLATFLQCYPSDVLYLATFFRYLPSYATPFFSCHRSDALYAAILLMLLPFLPCPSSYATTLLMLPPFWCPPPCHPSDAATILVPFTLPPSYATTLLMLPPFFRCPSSDAL